MMYKTLADDIGYGGIWEHTVYVIDAKESCDPQLTMKITLKHTSRNMLKVTVGMSTNLSSSTPDYVYEYPIFNNQGGPYYMQGGSSEADKTIECPAADSQLTSILGILFAKRKPGLSSRQNQASAKR